MIVKVTKKMVPAKDVAAAAELPVSWDAQYPGTKPCSCGHRRICTRATITETAPDFLMPWLMLPLSLCDWLFRALPLYQNKE